MDAPECTDELEIKYGYSKRKKKRAKEDDEKE